MHQECHLCAQVVETWDNWFYDECPSAQAEHGQHIVDDWKELDQVQKEDENGTISTPAGDQAPGQLELFGQGNPDN